jgi:hypothetical protein
VSDDSKPTEEKSLVDLFSNINGGALRRRRMADLTRMQGLQALDELLSAYFQVL